MTGYSPFGRDECSLRVTPEDETLLSGEPAPLFIMRRVGWCPVCGCDILDCGYDDDPAKWEHAIAGCEHIRDR